MIVGVLRRFSHLREAPAAGARARRYCSRNPLQQARPGRWTLESKRGKGLLYTPGHGLGAFTVPQFDRYMRRTYEL